MNLFSNEPVTQTETTKEQYRSHYFRIERMTKKEMGLDESAILTPQQLAASFGQHEPKWSEKTARAYRAALVFMFNEMGTQEAREAKDMIYHVSDDGEWTMNRKEEIKKQRAANVKKGLRTSSQKAKRLSWDDLDLLRAELHISKSKFAHKTMLWFMAGMLTGLRPTEWRDAVLTLNKKGEKILLVQNAKNTNGRAHGKEREIILQNLKPDDLAIIEDHVESIQRYQGQGDDAFEDYYYNCRRLISHVGNRLWPRRLKHPTLYTARHMFAADIKNQFDVYGVAALMGHASTRTASANYAPKWSSTSGGSRVEPSERDVAVVTARNEEKEAPRIAKRQEYIESLRSERSSLANKK